MMSALQRTAMSTRRESAARLVPARPTQNPPATHALRRTTRSRGVIALAALLSVLHSGAAGCAGRGAPQNGLVAPGRAVLLVLPRAHDVHTAMTLLDLVRLRLPLEIRTGRFASTEGFSTICVMGRRSGFPATPPSGVGAGGLSGCPMISAYLDGMRLTDAGAYMARSRALDFESIELLRSSDAVRRYGFVPDTDDVLVLFTRGVGPFAGS